MFTSLDTECRISVLRSHDWLQRSERINRLRCQQEARPHTPVKASIVATARTVVDACPVLRVAFPPAPASHFSTRR